MLGIILKILAILGWLLLFVLILLLLLLVLAAVYPVSYKIRWEKNADHMLVKAKGSWLLGLVRAFYEYPTPKSVIVKVLGFKVYDSGSSPEKKATSDAGSKSQTSEHQAEQRTEHQSDQQTGHQSDQQTGHQKDHQTENHIKDRAEHLSADTAKTDDRILDAGERKAEEEAVGDDPNPGIITRIRNFIENIIAKLRQICDKIKNFRELAEYYIKLLKEEDTIQLFSEIFTGTGNILKSIRPRKVKGQILLGTGSPDTTGYAMAVYGILSPYLGKNLLLTPDFEQKVLEGQLVLKGRIIIGVLLVDVLKVALDRRLRSFIKKWKREVI